MKQKIVKANFLLIISLILIVVVWKTITHYQLVNALFVPSPAKFIESTKVLFLERDFLGDIGISIFRVFAAWLISAILAIPLAVLMTSYNFLYKLTSPYIDFIRYLPVPTLIPITILFFGIGEEAKIVLLFIGTFFQLILLIIDDIHNIPREYFDLAYTLNFSKLKVMRLKIRSILPQIYNNSRITLGWCWTYLIIAELVASQQGIGHMIKEAQRFSNTSAVYVGIITMGIIGFLSDFAFKKGYPFFFKYEQKR